jgi:hypothetical protein
LTSRNGNRLISVKSPPPEKEDDLPRIQSGKENTFLEPPLTLTPLISGSMLYTDELEYSLAGQDTTEGDMVVDLDYEALSGQSESNIERRGSINQSKQFPWPAAIEGLQQGRRVDALDHRGQWFSGIF